jgi:hypothetical protein
MPTQKQWLTKTERQQYQSRLTWLEQMGIPIGHAVDCPPEAERITFDQTQYEIAKLYELPWGEVAVLVPAKMSVLKSGVLIREVAVKTPWDNWPLELWASEDSPYYQDVIRSLYHFPPTVLNPWLEPEVPLRPRQTEGVIIAGGYVNVPAECRDEALVKVDLLLRDERHNEFCFDFGVEVDRRYMREYERRRPQRQLELARSTGGGGLFAPASGPPGDQKRVPRESIIKQSHASAGMTQLATQELRNQTIRRPNAGALGIASDTRADAQCISPHRRVARSTLHRPEGPWAGQVIIPRRAAIALAPFRPSPVRKPQPIGSSQSNDL